MEFRLTDTQIMLQDAVLRLMRERYGFEQRKATLKSPLGFSTEVWAEYANLGLLGIEISDEYGGSGGAFADVAVVLELFGRGLAVEPYLSTVVLGAGLIAQSGSTSQKQSLLPAVAEGRIKLALAYGEPAGRFRAEFAAMAAYSDSQGYVLNGKKSVVLGADSADYLIVSAQLHGISLFLVPRIAAGLEFAPYSNVDDRRAAEVTFRSVRVEADALIGTLGGGLHDLELALDRGAVAICCEALGAITALNEITLEYLKTRSQFGRPIGRFQVLQHRMADMVIAEELARSIVPLAVSSLGSHITRDRAQAISAAKLQIVRSAEIVGRGAIQLHGGIGLANEYIAGHYFRRLTASTLMFGDEAFHLSRFYD